MTTITVNVNGQTHQVAADTTLMQLLQQLRPDIDLSTSPLASAVNGRHVARTQRAGCVLQNHDEITTFEPISGG